MTDDHKSPISVTESPCLSTVEQKATRKRSRKARKKHHVKFWTLTTLESENCDPKRLTPRQQLAYIALKASKQNVPALEDKVNGESLIIVKNDELAPKRRKRDCGKKDSSEITNKLQCSEEQQFGHVIDCPNLEPVQDSQILRDLIEIAGSQLAIEGLEEIHPNEESSLIRQAEFFKEEIGTEVFNYEDQEALLTSELPFLTSDIAHFIKSTNDTQRIRSDILENERRTRLTSDIFTS